MERESRTNPETKSNTKTAKNKTKKSKTKPTRKQRKERTETIALIQSNEQQSNKSVHSNPTYCRRYEQDDLAPNIDETFDHVQLAHRENGTKNTL